MINFFRKIRQRLLSENRFSTYLIYAIGEIALVVIGILIALQINNWNEESKNRKQESQILLQLKEEFEENLAELELKISMRKEMLDATTRLLAYYNNPKSWTLADSVASDFRKTFYTPTFNPVIGVTAELLSSGKLYVIENKRLKISLTNWTGVSSRLIEYEEDLRNHTENHYRPYFKENHSYRNIYNGYWYNNKLSAKKEGKSELVKELIKNQNLEDFIIDITSHVIFAQDESEIVKNHISDILELINLEINKK